MRYITYRIFSAGRMNPVTRRSPVIYTDSECLGSGEMSVIRFRQGRALIRMHLGILCDYRRGDWKRGRVEPVQTLRSARRGSGDMAFRKRIL
jgi:hypothetical protein